MRITLQYFDDCPNWRVAEQHLTALAREFAGHTVTLQEITTVEDAHRHGFRGSPSMLLDGVDPFPGVDEPFGLSCRMYSTPDGPAGSPTIDQLREKLSQAR